MDIESKQMVSHVSMPKRYIAAAPFYHFGFSQDTLVGLSLTKTHLAAFDVTQRVVDHSYLVWVHKLKHTVREFFFSDSPIIFTRQGADFGECAGRFFFLTE
jgi:hypothetical protein